MSFQPLDFGQSVLVFTSACELSEPDVVWLLDCARKDSSEECDSGIVQGS